MANSTSNIDLIQQNQSGKEVTANAFFNAASQAATYGRRASASSGLTWAYYGGNVRLSSGATAQIANGSLTLTASSTNYIVADKSTGAVGVSVDDTNWNDEENYWRLYSVVVGESTVTSWTDARILGEFGGGGGGGAVSSVNGQTGAVVLDAEDVGAVASLVAGSGITVDASDPQNPIVSATGGGGGREVLTADRTYYVRTDGDDNNDGLSNTAGGAFATAQRAYDVIAGTLDLGGRQVTIKVAAGTYSTGATPFLAVAVPWTGGGTLNVEGDTATPGNVVAETTTAAIFNISAGLPGAINLRGFKTNSTSGGNHISFTGTGTVTYGAWDFGAAGTGVQVLVSGAGAQITAASNYSITGGGGHHVRAQYGGVVAIVTRTITITGTPAFSIFAYAARLGLIDIFANTYSGAATGKRYQASHNSVIFTNGAGNTALPGNADGSVDTGGQYV